MARSDHQLALTDVGAPPIPPPRVQWLSLTMDERMAMVGTSLAHTQLNGRLYRCSSHIEQTWLWKPYASRSKVSRTSECDLSAKHPAGVGATQYLTHNAHSQVFEYIQIRFSNTSKFIIVPRARSCINIVSKPCNFVTSCTKT